MQRMCVRPKSYKSISLWSISLCSLSRAWNGGIAIEVVQSLLIGDLFEDDAAILRSPCRCGIGSDRLGEAETF